MGGRKIERIDIFDPYLIPNIGCASFNTRGAVCKGSGDIKIDLEKYCSQCLCYKKCYYRRVK